MGDALGDERESTNRKCLETNNNLKINGGSIGIRTLETVPRLHTVQACAFDHSATDPLGGLISSPGGTARGLDAKNILTKRAITKG